VKSGDRKLVFPNKRKSFTRVQNGKAILTNICNIISDHVKIRDELEIDKKVYLI
jgi:hypothetical protein